MKYYVLTVWNRKSQLAIEYAYQVQERSPETWVFWVHASSAARFGEGYMKIAERVKIPGWDKPEADIPQLVTDWLHNEANGRWVMIVDNADDPSIFFHQEDKGTSNQVSGSTLQAGSLSDLLPQSPNGSILITSRSREVACGLTESVS